MHQESNNDPLTRTIHQSTSEANVEPTTDIRPNFNSLDIIFPGFLNFIEEVQKSTRLGDHERMIKSFKINIDRLKEIQGPNLHDNAKSFFDMAKDSLTGDMVMLPSLTGSYNLDWASEMLLNSMKEIGNHAIQSSLKRFRFDLFMLMSRGGISMNPFDIDDYSLGDFSKDLPTLNGGAVSSEYLKAFHLSVLSAAAMINSNKKDLFKVKKIGSRDEEMNAITSIWTTAQNQTTDRGEYHNGENVTLESNMNRIKEHLDKFILYKNKE